MTRQRPASVTDFWMPVLVHGSVLAPNLTDRPFAWPGGQSASPTISIRRSALVDVAMPGRSR